MGWKGGGEACQHHLRDNGGYVFPCNRLGAHPDGWHEHHMVTTYPGLTMAVDVDDDGAEHPARGAVVLRWRDRAD